MPDIRNYIVKEHGLDRKRADWLTLAHRGDYVVLRGPLKVRVVYHKEIVRGGRIVGAKYWKQEDVTIPYKHVKMFTNREGTRNYPFPYNIHIYPITALPERITTPPPAETLGHAPPTPRREEKPPPPPPKTPAKKRAEKPKPPPRPRKAAKPVTRPKPELQWTKEHVQGWLIAKTTCGDFHALQSVFAEALRYIDWYEGIITLEFTVTKALWDQIVKAFGGDALIPKEWEIWPITQGGWWPWSKKKIVGYRIRMEGDRNYIGSWYDLFEQLAEGRDPYKVYLQRVEVPQAKNVFERIWNGLTDIIDALSELPSHLAVFAVNAVFDIHDRLYGRYPGDPKAFYTHFKKWEAEVYTNLVTGLILGYIEEGLPALVWEGMEDTWRSFTRTTSYRRLEGFWFDLRNVTRKLGINITPVVRSIPVALDKLHRMVVDVSRAIDEEAQRFDAKIRSTSAYTRNLVSQAVQGAGPYGRLLVDLITRKLDQREERLHTEIRRAEQNIYAWLNSPTNWIRQRLTELEVDIETYGEYLGLHVRPLLRQVEGWLDYLTFKETWLEPEVIVGRAWAIEQAREAVFSPPGPTKPTHFYYPEETNPWLETFDREIDDGTIAQEEDKPLTLDLLSDEIDEGFDLEEAIRRVRHEAPDAVPSTIVIPGNPWLSGIWNMANILGYGVSRLVPLTGDITFRK